MTIRQAGMKRRWLRIAVALGFAAFLVHWFYQNHRERRYDPIIHAAARRYGVDPALIKAVIWRESRFDPGVVGKVGEIGLMQVREMAGREWASAEKRGGFTPRHLFDPDANIYAGSWYLARLLKRYRAVDDPLPYALADYNAGRTRVLRWMQGGAVTNSAGFLAAMDFPGTRRYIEAVRNRRRRYQGSFPKDTLQAASQPPR
jgi:soluble lytic murein transglycosylase